MLTKRVIPCLDVKDGRVVKGVNFVSLRDAGDPVELAAPTTARVRTRSSFLDITATSSIDVQLRTSEHRRCTATSLSIFDVQLLTV